MPNHHNIEKMFENSENGLPPGKEPLGGLPNSDTEDRSVRTSSADLDSFWGLNDFSEVQEVYRKLAENENGVQMAHEAVGEDLPNREAETAVAAVELIASLQKEELESDIQTYSPKGSYFVEEELNNQALQQTQDIFEALGNGGAYLIEMFDTGNGIGQQVVYDELDSMNADYIPDFDEAEMDSTVETLEEYGLVEERPDDRYETTDKGESVKNLLDAQRTAI